MPRAVRIYLAGPDVFLANCKEIALAKKNICAQYGMQGVFPLDADVTGKPGPELGMAISAANENLIRSCRAMIANLTPFRGPSADVGTVYEIGFGKALGLLVCGYSNCSLDFTERVRLAEPLSYRDADGTLRDSAHLAVEEFGLRDNLMIDGGISSSGGVFVAEDIPHVSLYTDLKAFEKCVIFLTSATTA